MLRRIAFARRGILRRLWTVVRRVAAESNEDRLLGLAAETAFFAVLSIFPGLLIAAGLLSVLDVFVGADLAAGAREQVVSALDLLLTEEASGAVASVEALFAESRGSLLTFATLGALVTLSGAFGVVINALNLAYDTAERRSWLRRRLLGLAMGVATMVAVVLALAVLVVGPFLGKGADLADLVGLGPVFTFAWDVLRVPVLFAGLVLWAAALFHFAPSDHPGWRACLPGALATAVLWIVASLGFHLYLAVVAGGNPVLGAFGGGVIVMTWVYLLSLGLLLGGELNATLARSGRRVR
ncbi:YihY/virulence factor BrkB family protein [Pseudonocardia nigra]|uniref:YihY/virulence factor BrkB family protein n=1 Tax=Pseudonocardia nigra TaxID=1921578 RepID=UPI001C5E17BF|nr:YihY/virulence factor BrkB family protein [Pseudonocardia nigra]